MKIEALKEQPNFTVEHRLSQDKTLSIVQSEGSLVFSIKRLSEAPSVVPRHMIEGLPKIGMVPKKFFEESIVRATCGDGKVYFSGSLNGGTLPDWDIEDDAARTTIMLKGLLQSIEENAPCRYEAIEDVRRLAIDDKLTTEQKGEYLRVGIQSIERNLDTQYAVIESLAQQAMYGKLSSDQILAFKNLCSRSVSENWMSREWCISVLQRMD